MSGSVVSAASKGFLGNWRDRGGTICYAELGKRDFYLGVVEI
jgi:hypothetical protein